MAVDLTYCRPVSHDRAYFAEPAKMLGGRIDPPAFNLRNELMVGKHVHATVITRLHDLARDPNRPEEERNNIAETLRVCFPDHVSGYLFDRDGVRGTPFDLSPLQTLIERYATDLTRTVERAFRQGWPETDREVTRPEALQGHVKEMAGRLGEVISRLERRLRWALEQIRRLNALRERLGTLDQEEDTLFRRCDQLVKRLKGTRRRSRREAEGYDDTNTYGVLAAEGFLPGYGLEVGSILGTAEVPYWQTGAREFVLPRPPSVALREYVPGNLIYANGHRFVARRFHRDIDEQRIDMPLFEISVQHQAVKQVSGTAPAGSLGSTMLRTMAVCDVDLVHRSQISDEEDLRFQLGVTTYGVERDQHNGGNAYQWGMRELHHRRGVRLRLVNVGATTAIERHQRFGYPVCTICGQSVSPFSSDRQRELFDQQHADRCGRPVEPIGFYADVAADAVSLPSCPDQTTAYSVLEALRFAATRVLDMHMDDLQIVVIGHVDRQEFDGLLWDPMPGGSGLLDQMCSRFDEIARIARQVVETCPSVCDTSCIDCLQTFRNGYYHKHLSRQVALERLTVYGEQLTWAHEIPSRGTAAAGKDMPYPANEAERKLRELVRRAGFAEGVRGEQVVLDRSIGTTTPDIIYRADHHEENEGICIYLDGLSERLHGNPVTAEKDRRIRSWLRNNGYDVIEIGAHELDDAVAMTRHFRRLAGLLRDDARREAIRTDLSWFHGDPGHERPAERPALRLIRPRTHERYVKCVPFIPLQAAAGAFSEPHGIIERAEEWAEIRTGRKLREGMFVAQVVGKSMEPFIPDGAYCLFASPVTGTRQGKTVLVRLRDQVDPETGERFTVKRYESEKASSPDGTWRHVRITLRPANRDYEAIELKADDEEGVDVIAELVEVLT
jgi:SOS-response transcriptional repressor LexA